MLSPCAFSSQLTRGIQELKFRFEGMKAYRNADGTVRLFRPDKNMARMNRVGLLASSLLVPVCFMS